MIGTDILLDTCTFLWWASGNAKLPTRTVDLLRQPDRRLLLSAASAWEIAIKQASGRLQLPKDPTDYVPLLREHYGVQTLAVDEEAALHVAKLPNLHRDLFDRILVAQAIVHGLKIATPDPMIRVYPAPTLWLE